MIEKLKQNDHLGEMVGAWAGRHVEEAMAEEFNKKLVSALHKIWVRDSQRGKKDQFVDLSDDSQTSQIQKDAWAMIPKEAKKEIKRLYGEDGFMVRHDMVDNSVGFRGYSISEAWTGPSNMSPEVRKAVRDVATVIIGKNAFRVLVTAQKALQAGVSVAKNIILILSVVVPVANAVSNVGQLMMQGIGPRDLVNGFRKKLVEVEKLQKWEKRLSELTADKARHHNNEMMMRKLMAEEKSINDAIDRLSIGPLVRAGEFTSIVEGETEVDASISEGVWIDKMKAMIDRLPNQMGVVGRYAAITKDTALYKGLARSVQYGDFLSKSIMYDHQVKANKKAPEQALRHASGAFVNYKLNRSSLSRLMSCFCDPGLDDLDGLGV